MSELLGKPESPESEQPTLLPATLFPAYPGTTAKESGHACKGEGRCCGGCRNPKRPLVSADEGTAPSSIQDTFRESSGLPPVQS